MILDLAGFMQKEKPYWTELESVLNRIEEDPFARLSVAELQRLHYLYERAASDLAQLDGLVSEPQTRQYLAALVARAYGEMMETRSRSIRLHPLHWFFQTFPQTFRRHIQCFRLAVAVTLAGMFFGAMALLLDPEAKAVLMPFGHLLGSPAERVAKEEQQKSDALKGRKTSFAATLMTHNTKVSIFTMGMGVTWGVGTLILLFYNGVILGAVAADYLAAGQGTFLVGWLLPHGSVEIPAILLAGQAGLLLATTLLGRGQRRSLRQRLRGMLPDLVTLMGGVGLLLIWAGLVEAFFSQYHEPALPYALKIGLGVIELILLGLFLSRSGLKKKPAEGEE